MPRLALTLVLGGWAASVAAAPASGDALDAQITAFLTARHPQQNVDVRITRRAAAGTPCRAPEVFLPTRGDDATGRVTVGVRCPQDAPTLRYAQAYVSVIATYYVAARTIAPGETVAASDLRAVDGDISRLARSVATDARMLIGQVAVRRVAADMPVRTDMVAQPKLVDRGARVRVIARGRGFSITTEGVALDSAARGATLRVNTLDGRRLSGVAAGPNTVVIAR